MNIAKLEDFYFIIFIMLLIEKEIMKKEKVSLLEPLIGSFSMNNIYGLEISEKEKLFLSPAIVMCVLFFFFLSFGKMERLVGFCGNAHCKCNTWISCLFV